MKKEKRNILKRLLVVLILLGLILSLFVMLEDKPTFADSGFDYSYDKPSSHSSRSYSSYDDDDDDYRSKRNNNDTTKYNSTPSKPLTEEERKELIKFMIEMLLAFLAPFIIFRLIKFLLNSGKPKKKKTRRKTTRSEKPVKSQEEMIQNYISGFNENEFLQKAYEIYCDIQQAWSSFRLEDVQQLLTDELYSSYSAQLSTLEVKNEQNVMEDFKWTGGRIDNHKVENNTITIGIVCGIEFYDYIIDTTTNKVLRGNKHRKCNVTYEMKFRKTLDENKTVTKCPNCGADVEFNTSGICSYCHSRLVSENTQWVLTSKKVLAQK